MRTALLLAAFLPALAGAAEFEVVRPLDAAPAPLSATSPLAVLPPAMTQALSSLPATLPRASVAAAFNPIGTPAAVKAASAYYGPAAAAPTPAQALKIRAMKAMADTFLMSRGLWDERKMAEKTGENPSGLSGIVVAKNPGRFGTAAVYSRNHKYVVLKTAHVDRVPAALVASSLLHELVHHLNPDIGKDEILSHILQAEFDAFVAKWLAAAGLDRRLEPRTWLSALKDLAPRTLYYRWEARALRRAYESGKIVSHVASVYYAPARRQTGMYSRFGARHATSYNAGASYDGARFRYGSDGARRDLERLRGDAADYREKLRTETEPAKRAELQGWLGELEARSAGYERFAIPALENYERATGSALPK